MADTDIIRIITEDMVATGINSIHYNYPQNEFNRTTVFVTTGAITMDKLFKSEIIDYAEY